MCSYESGIPRRGYGTAVVSAVVAAALEGGEAAAVPDLGSKSGCGPDRGEPWVSAVRQARGGAFEAGVAVEPAVAADVTLAYARSHAAERQYRYAAERW